MQLGQFLVTEVFFILSHRGSVKELRIFCTHLYLASMLRLHTI